MSNAQGVNAANSTAQQNQAYYNAQLPQQQFNNELNKAGGIAGVSGQQSRLRHRMHNTKGTLELGLYLERLELL